MKSFCIYCGNSKPEAHEICGACGATPVTHEDLIYSIILCHSEGEPYLNFLSLEEIEALREEIAKGNKMEVSPQVFNQAQEAFSAVKSMGSPPLLNKFARHTSRLHIIILVLVLLGLIFGA